MIDLKPLSIHETLEQARCTLSLIVAVGRNGVIGAGGTIPWHAPKDLKYFKKVTEDHILIMGRKTYESLKRPLPRRLHIVVTRDQNFLLSADPTIRNQVKVVHSLEDGVRLAITATREWPKEIFLVGGGELYREGLPYCDRLYITEVEIDARGDTFFPEFATQDFEKHEVAAAISGAKTADQYSSLPLHFYVYLRRAKAGIDEAIPSKPSLV